MPPKFKRLLLNHGWWLLSAVALTMVILVLFVPISENSKAQTIMGVVGGLATFFYFAQKQRLGELEIFQRVFAGFNARYAEMNAQLQQLLGSSKPLSLEERSLLSDYFNLCAEEYFYFSAGIIDERIWQSWTSGILQYLDDPRVREFWLSEEAGGSYYGLTLGAVKASAARSSDVAGLRTASPSMMSGRMAA